MNAELIEGLKDLKTGAMVSLISIVLVLVSLVLIFGSVGMINPENPQAFLVAMGALGSFAILILIAVILGIIGFVMYFMATGHLKRYDPKLGIGWWGMVLQLVGLILMFVPILLLVGVVVSNPHANGAIAGAVLASLGLLIIGGLMIIVGAILFGIMLMRLGEDPNVESGFKTAGIIYLVGIVLSFIAGAIGEILGIVTTILIYINAKNSLERLGAW